MVSEIRTSIDRRSAVSGEAIRARIGPVGASARPLWSVMIPTYDCAPTCADARIRAGAGPGPELMQIEVVDDASSDRPRRWSRSSARGRVGFFRQPRNVGHVANFNTCLRARAGGWSTSSTATTAARRLLRGDGPAAAEPTVGAAFCRYIAIDEQGDWAASPRSTALRRAAETGREDRRRPAPADAVHGGAARGIRAAGRVRRARRLREDWEMWVRIAARVPGRVRAGAARPVSRAHASPAGRMLRGRERRDLRRVIEINREHSPRPGRRDRRQGVARDATHLPAARPPAARRRRTAAMWAQVREAVRSDPRRGCSPRRRSWSRRATSSPWPRTRA